MNVTTDNFIDALPVIKDSIDNSIAIAIDFEFCGGMSNSSSSFADAPFLRYENELKGTKKPIISQVGLAMVNSSMECDVYNIFHMPERSNRRSDMTLSKGSLQFLADNHFDFNQWVKKGVSSLRKRSADKFMNNKRSKYEVSDKYKVSESDLAVLQPFLDAFEELDFFAGEFPEDMFQKRIVDRPDGWRDDMSSFSVVKLEEGVLHLTAPSWILEKAARKYLLNSGFRYEETVHQKNGFIDFVVYKLEDDRDAEFMELRTAHVEGEIIMGVGVTLIFEHLIKAGKPIIGHNCMTDLIFAMNTFWDPENNPQTLVEFGHFLVQNNITLLDSKVLAKGMDLQETYLGGLYTNIRKLENDDEALLEGMFRPDRFVKLRDCAINEDYKVIEMLAKDDVKEFVENNAHEAGYDAYFTAYSFFALLQNYLPLFDLDIEGIPDGFVAAMSDSMTNSICAYGSMYPSLSLVGPQEFVDLSYSYAIIIDKDYPLFKWRVGDELAKIIPELKPFVENRSIRVDKGTGFNTYYVRWDNNKKQQQFDKAVAEWKNFECDENDEESMKKYTELGERIAKLSSEIEILKPKKIAFLKAMIGLNTSKKMRKRNIIVQPLADYFDRIYSVQLTKANLRIGYNRERAISMKRQCLAEDVLEE
ncbi:hypothetical protein PCE1_003282 [Barthelona sp. PCE]